MLKRSSSECVAARLPACLPVCHLVVSRACAHTSLFPRSCLAFAFASLPLIIRIINARAKQDNFQLICITHDEEFVDILGKAQLQQSSKAEYYWRISREESDV